MNPHASGGFPLGLTISISPFGGLTDGEMVMAAPRRVIEVSFSEKELSDLACVSRSRTEPASHVQRACILLTYREKPSLYATGRAIGVTHQTVERCLRRARKFGVMAALDDSPRPGREPTITSQARTFVVDLACRKPKDFGYPHEVWTTRLLAEHVRERAVAAGYACLARLAQGTLCKILAAPEVKPHKLRYYLKRRDPDFDAKMAEVVSVYREVEQLKQAAKVRSEETPAQTPAVAIISYDEKPGIQALANKAPDLPPKPMRHLDRRTRSRIRSIGDAEPAGRHRSDDRRRPRQRRAETSLARIRQIPEKARRRPSARDRDQAHPRQSLRPQIQGDDGLARPAVQRTLHARLHAQTRLLAQSRRGIFLQARPLRASPYPRRFPTGAGPENPRRNRPDQPPPRRSHMEVENCRGQMI